MQTQELLQNLLTQKYIKSIVIEGNYMTNKSAVLLDSQNGTVFSVSADFLFYFKDKSNNGWLTIPEELILNGKKYYPQLGDSITKNDGTTYYFTTKEAVIEMASSYFKKFIDPHYGIQTIVHGLSFFENIDDKSDIYWVIFQKFKSRKHQQIEAFVSSN
ncbi:hypothetical protein L1276_000507 [Flavobacterium sp. HSC-32F16]|uniref:hypothetical protein n=1 Tax=Flavobacterium sp. HSC-32F16 TaxID=2910964 RepID=UPI0020A27A28|nr:hypothetical protein [Flavobacterium sp. HSC-32F16]MCP2025367.1 hypothetical protein [Flavobacterium sp. HSC-32F16]